MFTSTVSIVPMNVTFLEVILICVIVIEPVTFLAAVTIYLAKKTRLFWLAAWEHSITQQASHRSRGLRQLDPLHP